MTLDGPVPEERAIYSRVPRTEDAFVVALDLGMSEARAREVILCAALQDAERTRQN